MDLEQRKVAPGSTVAVPGSNPLTAYNDLVVFVREIGLGAVRTVNINREGMLIVWQNGDRFAARYYPALRCGWPTAAIYIWRTFDIVKKPGAFTILQIVQAVKLSIDLTV